MAKIGARTWVVPGRRVPFSSHGPEPEFTSSDQVCVLNATDAAAELAFDFYYEDADPVGPYRLLPRGTPPVLRSRLVAGWG